jgi:D-alanyl-lipoteichoic acid acyltransferase DltB (MBOAT superfamily)
MVFNSLTFILFFLVVLSVHSLPLSWKARKLNLLVASYVFYAAWNPPFVILLWISTVVDWVAARAIARTTSPVRRRGFLLLSLGANLGMLGLFKYGNFLLESFRAIVAALGVDYSPPRMDILLPVGISFYTFQSLSYTLDVYLGRTRPWPSFLDFALFVTFFPQLVAGPIVRARAFLPQCVTPKRADARQLGWGASLLAMGLFEKVVLADAVMAPVADRVYGAAAEAGATAAWVGTLAFAGQIFFDFAGYSTCAIGAALALGFVLPDNFRFPYAAVGFSDFWRRWHISLSSWLRDYLYIPLGGNRHGPLRTNVNLLLTMLLGGLWHGASWRFVAWGGLHGIYLMGERLATRLWGGARWATTRGGRIGLGLLTYLLVNIAWVFFRAESFADAFMLLRAMLTGGSGPLQLETQLVLPVVAVTLVLLAGQWWLRDRSIEDLWRRLPWWGRSIALATLILCILLVPRDDRAFIYFQF